MISGNGSLSLRKKDMENQKVPATGFTKQFFAHKATAGATGINLNSLTTPPEMATNGFANPPAGQIANANLLFFQNNLTLVSSARGMLQKNLSYTVAGSTQINFIGFTALEGEVFTGTIDYAAQTGIKVVDATATPATGTLAASTTDFNVGQFFSTNKYSTTQVGACTVYLDGVQQYRNPNNSSVATTTGNYYELDSGGGSFSVIRFNVADPTNARNVTVIPTGLLSERPDGSMMAVIESVQGQVNSLAAYVAALAGMTTTSVLGSSPTNVDLKAFGDRVLSLEQTRALLNAQNTWSAYQNMVGRTDGTAPASGVIGEVKQFLQNTVTITSATTWTANGTPLTTLGPGLWLILGQYQGVSNSIAYAANISSSTTVPSTNLLINNTAQGASSVALSGSVAMTPQVLNVSAASFPLFAAAFASSGSTTLTMAGYAVRIA